MRLELETVLEAASDFGGLFDCCCCDRLRVDKPNGVLIGSTPSPDCSALYLIFVYSLPTN